MLQRTRKRHNRKPGHSTGNKSAVITWSARSDPTPAMTNVQARDNKPYIITSTVEFGTWATSSSTAQTFAGQSFKFADIGNAGTLASIFDQYKFLAVEVWFTPTYLDYAGGNPNSNYLTVVDYDDAYNLTSVAAALQYQNVTETQSFTGVYRKFVPHIAMALSGGSSTLAGVNEPAKWIDVALGTIPHFGVKAALNASNVTTYINLRARYTMAFRNVF